MAGEYAETKYLNTPKSEQPKGPVAMTQLIRGEDGQLHTTYVDAKTGEPIHDLKGYTVTDGTNYYTIPEGADANEDGKVDPDEATTSTQTRPEDTNRSSRTDALGQPKGEPGTASNNFGYKSKPGWLGPVSKIAGVINPGIGAVGMLAGKAYNVNNMDAVSEARKGLGLEATSGKGKLSQAMKDNKGQIANVNIGDKKYAVGFEAMSPDGKTNLTYNEAKQRAAVLGQKITETPKDEVTAAPEQAKKQGPISKALNQIFGVKDPDLPDQVDTVPGRVTPEVAATVTSSAKEPSAAAKLGLSEPTAPSSVADKETGYGFGKGKVGTLGVEQSQPGTMVAGVGLTSTLGPTKDRPNMPGAQLTGAIQQAVADTFGPGYSVSVNSGTEDAGHQHGSTRHKTGLAADFDVVDPTGKKVTDTAALNDLASKFAQQNPTAGIGFGKGYMAPGRMHLDVTGQAKEWGALNTRANMDPALAETIDAARQGYAPTPFANAPTPTANLGPTPTEVDRNYAGQGSLPGSYASQDEKTNTGSIANAGIVDHSFQSQDERSNTGSIANAPNYGNFTSQDERESMANRLGMPDYSAAGAMPTGPTATPGAIATTNQKLGTTPAALAAMGFSNRTAQEKEAMARTIAGELGQKSLAALARDDANAKKEVGTMVATMENRAGSKKYSGIAAVQAPSQYNSLMAANLGTTNQNYANNPAVSAAVKGFYSGQTPANYSATSYHATAMANPPSWSGAMKGTESIGQHTFGNLSEYGPSQASKDAAKAFGTMAGTSFSPGKAKDDAQAGVYGGMGSGFASSPGSNTPGSSSTSDKGEKGDKGESSSGSGGSSGSSQGGTNSGGLGSSKSDKSSKSSAGGGYASSASKGSTGGL